MKYSIKFWTNSEANISTRGTWTMDWCVKADCFQLQTLITLAAWRPVQAGGVVEVYLYSKTLGAGALTRIICWCELPFRSGHRISSIHSLAGDWSHFQWEMYITLRMFWLQKPSACRSSGFYCLDIVKTVKCQSFNQTNDSSIHNSWCGYLSADIKETVKAICVAIKPLKARGLDWPQ